MKRSRTCQCLQELDVPKRSRSTPDLGVLERKSEVLWGRVARNKDEPPTLGMDSALRLHLQPQPAGVHQRAATLVSGRNGGAFSSSLGNGSFVSGSIVRSQGSLNEMTILEHEQFIGEESIDMGIPEASAGSPLPDGGAGSGHMIDDSGDSSDYFCGVDSNSDEADDEDGACGAVVVNLSGGGHNTENGVAPPRASAKSGTAEVVVQQHQHQHQQKVQLNGDCTPEFSSSEVKSRGYGGPFVSRGWTTVDGTPERGLECKHVSPAVAPTASCSRGSGTETNRATVSPPWPYRASDTTDWRGEAATPSLHVTIEATASFATRHLAPPNGMESCSAPCRPSPGLFGKSDAALEVSVHRRHRSCHSLPISCVGEEVKVTLNLERLQLVDNPTPNKVPAKMAEMGPEPLWKCRESSMVTAKGPMEHHRRGLAYL